MKQNYLIEEMRSGKIDGIYTCTRNEAMKILNRHKRKEPQGLWVLLSVDAETIDKNIIPDYRFAPNARAGLIADSP